MSALVGSDGDALMRLAAGGDRGAQANLLEHYRKRLRRMIAIRIDRRVTARTDPSDIVQEAMRVALVRGSKEKLCGTPDERIFPPPGLFGLFPLGFPLPFGGGGGAVVRSSRKSRSAGYAVDSRP